MTARPGPQSACRPTSSTRPTTRSTTASPTSSGARAAAPNMAGTDHRRRAQKGGPAIILVEPQLGENIGTAARAMYNCGLTDLRLVKPRDGWPNKKAQSAASGADPVLDKARLYDTVEEAIDGLRH